MCLCVIGGNGREELKKEFPNSHAALWFVNVCEKKKMSKFYRVDTDLSVKAKCSPSHLRNRYMSLKYDAVKRKIALIIDDYMAHQHVKNLEWIEPIHTLNVDI